MSTIAKRRRRLRLSAAVGLVSLLGLATVSCSSSSHPAAGASNSNTPATAASSNTPAAAASSSGTGCGTYTAADVAAQTGGRVDPVYEVPKCLPATYNLAFINPGFSIQYFNTWHTAMEDAAKYYKVNFTDVDLQLKFDQTVAQYQTLALKHPDVVGALYTPGLVAPSEKDGIIYLNMGKAIDGYQYNYGAADETAVGKLGGTAAGDAAKQRLDSSWKGKNVVLVKIGDAGDTEVTKRLAGGEAAFTAVVPLQSGNVVDVNAGCDAQKSRSMMADVLTAHPKDAIVVLGCNDEAGAAALTSIKSADRGKDAILITYGGDQAGRDAMKTDTTGAYVAMVDFNPYSQGWNWVAAAIAAKQGVAYKAYTDIKVNSIVTRQDVGAPQS